MIIYFAIILTTIFILGMFSQKDDKQSLVTCWTAGVTINILVFMSSFNNRNYYHTGMWHDRYYYTNTVRIGLALFSILILTIIYFAQINNLNDKKINGQ